MVNVVHWSGYFGARLERKVMASEKNQQQEHNNQSEHSDRSHRLRGIMGIFSRRKEGWAYHIQVRDYPTTIGTGSDHLSRDELYAVLNGIDDVYDDAMIDLANTPLEDPDEQPKLDLLPVPDDGQATEIAGSRVQQRTE